MFDKKKMMGGGVLLSHLAAGGKVEDDYEDASPGGDRQETLRTIASELIDAVHAKDPERLAQCLDALTAVGDDESAEGEMGPV